MSLPEVLLLIELKKRPGGYKFRPQCPLAGVTADFACLSARLVIEVDGGAHDREEQANYDIERDRMLRDAGFAFSASRPLRFCRTWKAYSR